MYLYFKDNGTLHMRSRVRDEWCEDNFTKKCQVPDNFDLTGVERSDDEGLVSYSEKTYDEVIAANTYSDLRAVAYPSIEEQLDMQYHDSLNGTTTWKDAITNVKTSIPKTA